MIPLAFAISRGGDDAFLPTFMSECRMIPPGMRVGIVEDDASLATQLKGVMESAGHRGFLFDNGQKLITFLKHETLDLLLLDWGLPGLSGMAVMHWLQENDESRPPVLMLSCRSSEEDIVAALRAGADDYVTKPIQPSVLIARIEAVCRRSRPEPAGGTVERYGDYMFDTRLGQATMRGEPVALAAKEFALALMLFRNLHRTLSRSYLFETLWGHSPDMQTRTLDAHMSRVRGKLQLRPENGLKLVPVYAHGYRLEALERAAC
jgi:DNA-binding response OmpR family regulator